VRTRAATTAGVLALLLGGCVSSRTRPPDVSRPQGPLATTFQRFPTEGISFYAPVNWFLSRGTPPDVEQMTSGPGVIAIWRYPRSEPLPTTAAALERARHALARAARARDPTLRIVRDQVTHVAHHHAVMLLARETIDGELRDVRSAHVYADHSEYVIDELSPPSDFPRLDRGLFLPVLRSLRLFAPR
jgi:hypothetical protein